MRLQFCSRPRQPPLPCRKVSACLRSSTASVWSCHRWVPTPGGSRRCGCFDEVMQKVLHGFLPKNPTVAPSQPHVAGHDVPLDLLDGMIVIAIEVTCDADEPRR